MRYVAAVAVLACSAGSAWADEIVLRNGARFEGKVKEQGDTVTVVMDFGSMTFRKIDVHKIHRGTSALAEFDARVLELGADDLDGKVQLAVWGRQNELHHRSRNLLEDVLSRNPDHAGAREALGYRRHKGRWLTEDELKTEQGFVLYRGEWMRKEVVLEFVKMEAELEARRIREYELEELRVRAFEAEAAARRAEADAAAAQAQAASDYYYSRPIVYYGYFQKPCWTRPPHCEPSRPVAAPTRGGDGAFEAPVKAIAVPARSGGFGDRKTK